MHTSTMLHLFFSGEVVPEVFDVHVRQYLSSADHSMLGRASRATRKYAATEIRSAALQLSEFVTSKERLVWALIDQKCDVSDETLCVTAARFGVPEAMQWLRAERWEPRFMALCGDEAAEHGNLSVLKFLHSSGYELRPRTWTFAARRGQTEVLAWIFDQICDEPHDLARYRDTTIEHAARHGHIETVKWLASVGCRYGHGVKVAACGGHFLVLQWILKHDVNTLAQRIANKYLCGWAGKYGHLEILQWARGMGYR